MKGSAITGPVGKEAADLWPKIASAAGSVLWFILLSILNNQNGRWIRLSKVPQKIVNC